MAVSCARCSEVLTTYYTKDMDRGLHFVEVKLLETCEFEIAELAEVVPLNLMTFKFCKRATLIVTLLKRAPNDLTTTIGAWTLNGSSSTLGALWAVESIL